MLFYEYRIHVLAPALTTVTGGCSGTARVHTNGGRCFSNFRVSKLSTLISLSKFNQTIYRLLPSIEELTRSDSFSWVDITETLRGRAAELKIGEMYNLPGFSLFDSMSALELMDPKMDSGMIGEREEPVVPVKYRLKYSQLTSFVLVSLADVL